MIPNKNDWKKFGFGLFVVFLVLVAIYIFGKITNDFKQVDTEVVETEIASVPEMLKIVEVPSDEKPVFGEPETVIQKEDDIVFEPKSLALMTVENYYYLDINHTGPTMTIWNNLDPKVTKFYKEAQQYAERHRLKCVDLPENLMFLSNNIDERYRPDFIDLGGDKIKVTVGKDKTLTYVMNCVDGSCKIKDLVDKGGSSFVATVSKYCLGK